LEDIETLLNNYEPGRPENKPDVIKQIEEIRIQREKQAQQQQQQMQNVPLPPQILFQLMNFEKKINEQNVSINELQLENNMLKDKNKYLEEKISDLIKEIILLKKI